jgi:alpha/beta superfamily hydrolase
MTPISLDGCFGWLHLPTGVSRNAAVVLCPGLKIDEITGYSSLKLLADALAEQGYPVLRLQYTGTGDSIDPGDVEYWATWLADIQRAIDWLRANCRVKHIVLCGLRFGATLASVVATSQDVGLILLAPVMRGRTYIRQLQSDGFINVGARLSVTTTELIGAIDLRKLSPRASSKVALFAQSLSSLLVTECVAGWRASGSEVTVADFTGLDTMLRPTFANHEAPAAIEPIITWIRAAYPDLTQQHIDLQLPEIEIRSDRWIETPLHFGGALFGILCRSRQESSRMAVLMGNSSADPHCIGTTVELSRALAAKGVASLRMDFAGIGDSLHQSVGSHVFEINRCHDFSAAIDALQRLGYAHFATEGLCSGAYHAYHGAISDDRIEYALLINLPFFDWVPGFPVEDLVFHARKPSQLLREMQTKLFWVNMWGKIRRGDTHIIRNRFVWLERKLKHVPGFGSATKRPAMSPRVKMLFMVSEGDISGDVLKREFGVRLPPGIKVELVDGLDHSMQRPNIREVIASRIITFIEEDHPMPVLTVQESMHGTPVLAGRLIW